MKTYQTAAGLSITGKTLQDAIRQNMGRIAGALRLGNPAGYQLHQAYAEYDKEEKAVVLHITACGSDTMPNYDPAEDIPKPYSIAINASEDDCPERLDIETVDSPTFNPFDDACLTSPISIYGAMLGIVDEISMYHCRHRLTDGLAKKMMIQMPNSIGDPYFTEACFHRLMGFRPMFATDKEALRMAIRVLELMSKSMDYGRNELLCSFMFQDRTAHYFKTLRYTTALATLREAKGMTEEQLADAAQMTVKQLRRYEKSPGSTLWHASKSVIGRLADALGVEKSEIIEEDDSSILCSE